MQVLRPQFDQRGDLVARERAFARWAEGTQNHSAGGVASAQRALWRIDPAAYACIGNFSDGKVKHRAIALSLMMGHA